MGVLINLTPHPLVLCGETIPPSGVVLRAEQVEEEAGVLDGVPVLRVRLGRPIPSPEELPSWGEGAFYIVSALAAQSVAQYHPDIAHRFLSPGRLVRDDEGKVVGAQALVSPT